MWSTGRELIYRSRGWFRTVTITAERELDIVGRDSLFADVFARGTAFRNYDVFPNGELAVVERTPGGERLIGMTNWTVRLRR